MCTRKMRLRYLALFLILIFPGLVCAGTLVNQLGGARGFGENTITNVDEYSTPAIDITGVFPGGLDINGTNHTKIYVGANGIVSFNTSLASVNEALTLADTMVGFFPYYSDVDTKGGVVTPEPGGNSTGANSVHYDLDTTNNIFTATWDNVGYYNAHKDKTNSFQVRIIGLGAGDFDVQFIYEDTTWTTGDWNGGANGLGGVPAIAGYSIGVAGGSYRLPESGNQEAMLSLASGPDRIFSVRDGVVSNAPAGLTASSSVLTFAQDYYGARPNTNWKTLTLTNNGSTFVTLGSLPITSSFKTNNDFCSNITLQPAESCTVSYNFWPEALGDINAKVVLKDPGGTIPLANFTLTGNSITPISGDKPTLNFPITLVGSTSTAQTVTLSNNAPFTVYMGPIVLQQAYTENFIISNDACSNMSLAQASTCTFDVAFHPTAITTYDTSLEANSSSLVQLASVQLSGGGASSPNAEMVSTNPIQFANIPINNTVTATFVLRNTGSIAAPILPVMTVGPFAPFTTISNDTCSGATIAPMESCSFQMNVLSSISTSSYVGADVWYDSGAGTQSVHVEFNVSFIQHNVALLLSPPVLTFPTTVTNSPGTTVETFTLTNFGPDVVELSPSGVVITGPGASAFQIYANYCPATLPVGGSCQIQVKIASPTAGTHDAQLLVYYYGTEGFVSAGMTGLIEAPPEIVDGARRVVVYTDGITWNAPSLATTDQDTSAELLIWSVATPPAHGSAQVEGTGFSPPVFTYQPEPGFFGMDSFVVQVTDGKYFDSITIFVMVQPAASPVAFKWALPLRDPVLGVAGELQPAPAIGSDGTVYVGDNAGGFKAVNPDGTIKWSVDTGSAIIASPAIGTDGTIYNVSYDGLLYALNPDGSTKWTHNSAANLSYSSPALGPDGTIYYATNTLLNAVSPNGSSKWSVSMGFMTLCAPAVASDGTIYVVTYGNKVLAINPDGTTKWEYQATSQIFSSPAIGADGTIYTSSTNGTVLALSPAGALLWSVKPATSMYSSPAVASDGTIYVYARNTRNLVAINPDGTIKWQCPTGSTSSFSLSSPAVAANGVVYMPLNEGNLLAINRNGTILVTVPITNTITSSPVIAPDGTVYLTDTLDNLLAFSTTSGGLADTPWPKFKGNEVQNSSRWVSDRGDMTVKIAGVDTNSCPEINFFASIENPLGKTVYSTGIANLKVSDAGGDLTVQPQSLPGTFSPRISIALALDYAYYMTPNMLADMQAAASSAVNFMNQTDAGEIIKFASSINTTQFYTEDKALLVTAVSAPYSGTKGATALYGAINKAVGDTSYEVGRKAVIVISGGKNTSGAVSEQTLISNALQNGVPVFGVSVGSNLTGQAALSRISAATGGRYYHVANTANLGTTLIEIIGKIRNQYQITFTPSVSDGTAKSFSVAVTGLNGNTFSASRTANTCFPPNQAPLATDALATTDEDTPKPITLTGTDADGDLLAYTIETQPAHGTVTGVPPAVTYTPAANYNGVDSFTFKASDGEFESLAQISLTINPVNDAPTVSNIVDYTRNEDSTLGPIVFTVSDIDSTLSQANLSAHSSNQALFPDSGITLGVSGASKTIKLVPVPNASGTATITVSISDGALIGSDTFVVTMRPVNDAPSITTVTLANAAAYSNYSVPVAGYDVDASDTVIIMGVSLPTWLTVNPTGNGTALLQGMPSAADIGTTNITLRAADYAGAFTDKVFSLTVGPEINPPAPAPTLGVPTGTYTNDQSVAITSSVANATLVYTLDGTIPSRTNGTMYTGPVAITATRTLKAIAYLAGSYSPSPAAYATYTLKVGQPTFAPSAGTYATAQNVVISSVTTGATIRYTLDGTSPTISTGTIYTGAISVTASKTIKAAGFKTGYTNSNESTAAFNFVAAQAATPAFSPVGGTYTTTQSVTITTATAGATIRYSVDGTVPTQVTGTIYTAPITVATSQTIKAIAFKAGEFGQSAANYAAYTIKVGQPTANPPAGTYVAAQTVSLTSTTTDAIIRYTLDGTTPTETTGAIYTAPFVVSANKTLKAAGYKTGFVPSNLTTAAYVFVATSAATPTFSPLGGTYTNSQTVTISTATAGATIRYTLDGSLPTQALGTTYTGPVVIDSTKTIKAIAYKASAYGQSTVGYATYTMKVGQPTVTPLTGEYLGTANITMSTSTLGATIRYTTDGTVPTSTTGSVYVSAVPIDHDFTLNVRAFRSGFTDSNVVTATYTVADFVEQYTGMTFKWVPPGTFTMGDTFGGGGTNETPNHQVTISRGFYLSAYETTQEQWEVIKGTNPSFFKTPTSLDQPVEMVSYSDVLSYITQLNTTTGRTFRLPTEAEWEYAAGYGATRQKYSGTSDIVLLPEYAWYTANAAATTHSVGAKLPNALGLYDMSGNVSEWVYDWYGLYTSDAATDPTGPTTGTLRIIRGGSWQHTDASLRAAFRASKTATTVYQNIGFRLVVEP